MSPRGKENNDKMRADTKEKILEASLDVFSEFGYHGATMRKIAGAAGLSLGLVYHYFPTKEKVFRHLVDYALDASFEGMRVALSSPGSAWERIEAHAALVVGSMFQGKTARYFLLVLQALTQAENLPGLRPGLSRKMDRYHEILVPAIEEAQADGDAKRGDPEVLASVYLSMIHGLSTLPYQGKSFEKRVTPDLLSGVLSNREPRRKE